MAPGISGPTGRFGTDMKTVRGRLGMGVALLLLVGCDHVTKLAARSELQDGAPRNVLSSVLRLQYVEHRDVAFDLLRLVPERPRAIVLAVLGAVAIVALAAVLMRGGGSRVARAGFLLTLAGALGNYTDRLVRGFVVDFIRLPYWPVFNVADMLVVAGVALLCWDHAHRLRSRPTPA